MSPITFDVLGEPKSQPRPKAARIGGFVRIYTPKTADDWKAAVKKTAASFVGPSPITEPLLLALHFRFARPKAHLRSNGDLKPAAPEHHAQKPDADNLAKAVMDALTDCGLWQDDDQIVALYVTKTWADQGQAEGCNVVLHLCPSTTSPVPSAAPATPSPITESGPIATPAGPTPEPNPCPTNLPTPSPASVLPSLKEKRRRSRSVASTTAPANTGVTS